MRILILALSACVAGSAVAQSVPTSGHAFPAGGAAGSTFTARLSGTDWTPDVRFVSHDSRVRIEPLGPPGPVLVPLPPYWLAPKSSLNDPGLPREVEARITLSADLPEGPVRWRAVNACGSKGSGLFMVGRGHEMIENESTTGPRKLDRLPVTVSGRLGRIEETDVYAFTASRTGAVVVELFARRLGSDFNGVLEARDSTGRVLAECADTSGRDAVLAFDAKAGEKYAISLRDVDYRGYHSFTYRLHFSEGPRVRACFPSAGRCGQSGNIEFSGHGLVTGAARLESVNQKMTFPVQPGPFIHTFDCAGGMRVSATLNAVAHSEVLESAMADVAGRLLVAPVGVSGILATDNDVDEYRIEGMKGKSIEVRAVSTGLPSTDLVLRMLDANNVVVGKGDDSPGSTDPVMAVTFPADGSYKIRIWDQSGANRGASVPYHLAVQPTAADFRLEIPAVFPLLIGGEGNLTIKATRLGGFKEAIDIVITGKPAWAKVPDKIIVPAGADSVVVKITAGKDAPVEHALVRVEGKASIAGVMVTRRAVAPSGDLAVPGTTPLSDPDVMLLCSTIKPLFKGKVVEADGGRRVHRGATHLAEITLERLPGFQGEIVLDMAATQSRHRQGIRGPALVVQPGATKVDYPIFMPEGLETTRTSRMALVMLARMNDGAGKSCWVCAPVEGQVTMSIEGALMKLTPHEEELVVVPGQKTIVRLRLTRASSLLEPTIVEMLGTPDLNGPSIVAPTGAELVEFPVAVSNRFTGSCKVGFRATTRRQGHPVVSETEVIVESMSALEGAAR